MDYSQIFALTAKKVGVSVHLLTALCMHESGGLKNVLVPDDMGSPSFGVCQVKSETSKMFGYSGTKEELMNPKMNILIAAKYLKYQLKRYSGDKLKALAAYNSGTYFPGKVPGCPTNLGYVKKVKKYIKDQDLSMELECNLFAGVSFVSI